MKDVSPRQLAVLRIIADTIASRGVPPTVREIATAMGISSTNGVEDHLRRLESRGAIQRYERRARTLQLTPAGRALLANDGGEKTIHPITNFERLVVDCAERWLDSMNGGNGGGDSAEDDLVMAIESLRAAKRGAAA